MPTIVHAIRVHRSYRQDGAGHAQPNKPKRSRLRPQAQIIERGDAVLQVVYPNQEATMRSHHVIAIATAVVIGLGVKLLFISGPSAEAKVDPVERAGVDVSKMPVNAKLPIETIHDMTFVFSHSE
jgi:hypothetical protein